MNGCGCTEKNALAARANATCNTGAPDPPAMCFRRHRFLVFFTFEYFFVVLLYTVLHLLLLVTLRRIRANDRADPSMNMLTSWGQERTRDQGLGPWRLMKL